MSEPQSFIFVFVIFFYSPLFLSWAMIRRLASFMFDICRSWKKASERASKRKARETESERASERARDGESGSISDVTKSFPIQYTQRTLIVSNIQPSASLLLLLSATNHLKPNTNSFIYIAISVCVNLLIN